MTFRTVELLRSLIGATKWGNAAQLMVLLKGLGRELHAAGGFREPAIGNIVRRIMHAVRQEVENADVQDNTAAAAAVASSSMVQSSSNDSMQPIDENLSQSFNAKLSLTKNNNGIGMGMDSTAPSRSPSLVNLLWANPQHLTYNDRRKKGLEKRTRRTDSFSSVDSDPLDHMATTGTAVEEYDFPPSFYVNRQHFKDTIMEVIQEFMSDLEDLHKNINDQATSHIHAGEVVLTYGRSKTVESVSTLFTLL